MREGENDEWLMIMADKNSDSNQRMLKISNEVMLFKIGNNCLMMIHMKWWWSFHNEEKMSEKMEKLMVQLT